MNIYYSNLKGYKYFLEEDFECLIPMRYKNTNTEYISLYSQSKKSVMSLLTIRAGYMWDGPSGPTIDTKNFMRGALIHDALYQLIREDYLKMNDRKQADKILRKVCLEDGMSRIRAWYIYTAVHHFAEWAATPKEDGEKKIICLEY